jgi:nitrogen fixation protein FixH
MTRHVSPSGTFTGRHMLLIMVAFFAVIIAVNVTMATLAGTSWTGFVVRNSYIASQEFNGKVEAAREQIALGWQADLVIASGDATLTLKDAAGDTIALAEAALVFRSPASEARDRIVELSHSDSTMAGGAMAATAWLADGLWVVEIDILTAAGRQWRETRRITIADGSLT